MKQYNVSRITVQRAINELKQQGIVLRRPRAGTFVRKVVADAQSGQQESAVIRDTPDRVSIGVVAPFDLTMPSIYQYLNGIMSAMTPSRDNINLHNTDYNTACERTLLENCLQDGCSGILYYPGVGFAPPLDLLMQMVAKGYPCVLMDKRLPDVNLPCVQVNNVAAAKQITSHLIGKGHRNIAFVISTYTMSVYERYIGFCEAMNDAGLTTLDQMCYPLDALKQNGETMEDLVETLLERGVTAVCCCADQPARRLMDACQRLGVDVPGKLAIAGFDAVYPGEITSMLQPYAQIGLKATQILIDWILTGKVERTVTQLEAALIPGRSTEGSPE